MTYRKEPDANRIPNTMRDGALIEFECRHYGLTPPSQFKYDDVPGALYYLLRHIYGNRDATIGALEATIRNLKAKLAEQ